MSPARRFAVPALCALSLAMACLLAADVGRAWSAPEDTGRATRWEYITSSVESGTLQSRLTELGLEGWDVFSIERSTAAVEETPNATARLVVDHYQVTAKRPAKR